MSAIDDIAAERRRQIEVKGWTPDHDDTHDGDELAWAAVAYAAPDGLRRFCDANDVIIWPWEPAWWKPKDRRRDLVRAGALILAEIERLDRVETTPEKGD